MYEPYQSYRVPFVKLESNFLASRQSMMIHRRYGMFATFVLLWVQESLGRPKKPMRSVENPSKADGSFTGQ